MTNKKKNNAILSSNSISAYYVWIQIYMTCKLGMKTA